MSEARGHARQLGGGGYAATNTGIKLWVDMEAQA